MTKSKTKAVKATTFVAKGVRLNGTISATTKRLLVATSKKTNTPQSVIVNNALTKALTAAARNVR